MRWLSLDAAPAEITWEAGVDVLSFGATKNGALGAEAVVFFNPELAADFELRRKRAAHLFSKMRYLSAQLLACLEGNFFLANAARANALATRIGRAAGSRLLYPVEANAVFLRFAPGEKAGTARTRLRLLRLGRAARGLRAASWSPGTSPRTKWTRLCEALLGADGADRHRREPRRTRASPTTCPMSCTAPNAPACTG